MSEILHIYSVPVLAVLGVLTAAFVIADLLGRRNCLKTYKADLLILFFFINIISIIVNIKYGFFENILCMFTLFVNYFIMYNVGMDYSREQVVKYFNEIFHVLLLLYTSVVLFSLMSYGMQHSHVYYSQEGQMIRNGFVENRLFGLYTDPNYASVLSLVLLIVCIYYMVKTDEQYKKVLYGISGFFHFCYMILSGSRTAVLAMIAALLVGGYFIAYRKLKNKNWSNFKRQSGCILAAVMLTVVSYGGMELLRLGLSHVPAGVAWVLDMEEKQEQISFVREDIESSDDYSNNRFEIWANAFRIFKEKPFFGTSPRNMIAFAKEVFPASYIARTEYMVHNSVFETMVFTGIPGVAALMLFILSCAYRTFEHLYKKTEENFEEVLLGAVIIVAMMVSAMTLSALFYNRGSYNTVFWLTMGFLIYFVPGCKKGEGKALALADKLLTSITKEKS